MSWINNQSFILHFHICCPKPVSAIYAFNPPKITLKWLFWGIYTRYLTYNSPKYIIVLNILRKNGSTLNSHASLPGTTIIYKEQIWWCRNFSNASIKMLFPGTRSVITVSLHKMLLSASQNINTCNETAQNRFSILFDTWIGSLLSRFKMYAFWYK